MSLKLFRSTGYSSILAPGETRLATHPGWVVLAVSMWIGFACNVAVWREVRTLGAGNGLARTLLAGALIAASCAIVLSLFGWRRTLKPFASVLLLLAALGACCVWIQGLPVDSNLLDRGLKSLLVPSWASFLRWQVPALLVGLALVPMLWVWQVQVRRLPGPHQLASNALGMLLGVAAAAACGWLLFG
jgi:glucan phosphoethanolaminetransferase (alkaline phosphatase superfamily)